MMNQKTMLKIFLPTTLIDNFELINSEEFENDTGIQLDLFFDEKKIYPEGHSSVSLDSKGFRNVVSFSDFPIQNKAVRLYVRRRKWQEKATGNIISKSYDFTHEGTSYSNGLASFLKDGA